jgi:hypothetical protein
MRSRWFILCLVLSCLAAQFHCPLEQAGWLQDCCEAGCGDHEAETESCTECPDFLSLSASTIAHAPRPTLPPLFTPPWDEPGFVRHFAPHGADAPPESTSAAFPPPPSGSLLALISRTATLRGPPALS